MADQPIYTPFFGSMGATAAMAFSGKIFQKKISGKKILT